MTNSNGNDDPSNDDRETEEDIKRELETLRAQLESGQIEFADSERVERRRRLEAARESFLRSIGR